ncbi:MAG: APC family permease [Anaerovoracaceae bacterium]
MPVRKLTKVLGRTDIIALGFGTVIGWSWVVLATTWITGAGFWGTIIGFSAGAVLIFLVGLIYVELTSALPLSGGEMVYAYRAGGKAFGWAVGWIMSLAYLGVAAWEGIALATAVDYLFPLPKAILLWEIAGYPVYFSWALVGMVGGVIMLILNLFGAKPAAIFQVMATAGIIAVGLMMLFGGITFGSTENIGPGVQSFSGILYVMLIIPSMLIGFDVIPQSAEEMNISPRDIGKTLLVCIVISFAWYMILIVGVGFSAPAEIRMSGVLPTADVMAYAYGNERFGLIIVVGGILGILTSWNGFFMGATRLIFAMGRAKMLPDIFGRLGRRYKTPWAAILLVGLICILTPLLGKNALIWLVNISSICALIAYCCQPLSFLLLRKKEPELNRPIHLPMGVVGGTMIFILTVAYLALYLYMALNGKSYLHEGRVIGVWLVLGLVLYWFSTSRARMVSAAQMEQLVFGENLARERVEEAMKNHEEK